MNYKPFCIKHPPNVVKGQGKRCDINEQPSLLNSDVCGLKCVFLCVQACSVRINIITRCVQLLLVAWCSAFKCRTLVRLEPLSVCVFVCCSDWLVMLSLSPLMQNGALGNVPDVGHYPLRHAPCTLPSALFFHWLKHSNKSSRCRQLSKRVFHTL